MDQRTSDIEADLKNILQTRLALADKLQFLERRVEETVEETKNAALDIIAHAKNTAVEFVESTTAQLNPAVQASKRPWMLVGGAIAVGLAAGWLEQRKKSAGRYAYAPPKAHPAEVMPSEGGRGPRDGVYPFYTTESQAPPFEPGRYASRAQPGKDTALKAVGEIKSLLEEFTEELAKERERLKVAAIETGRTFLQELAHIAVQSLVDALSGKPGARPSQLPDNTSRYEEAAPTRPRAAA